MSLTLEKSAETKVGGPLLLVVLDGVGMGTEDEFNAVHRAKTPTLDGLIAAGPRKFTTLKAHGKAVGLPTDEDMGNSEVGHNAIGCGRVVLQGASLVDTAVRDASIFETDTFAELQKVWNAGGTLHLIGLISDGGVHSRLDQLLAIIDGCAERGCKRIRVHGLADGRDVPDLSAHKYFLEVEEHLLSLQGIDAKIASGGGRMHVTMDRYGADWRIVERGWQAHVLGEARAFSSALEAIETFRQEDESVSDQFLPAFTVVDDAGPVGPIVDGDAVICFNFRGDRVIEISRAFEEKDFSFFDRIRVPKVFYAGVMEYDGDLHIPSRYLVSPPQIEKTASEYLAHNGVRSFACSETQKYGHVTYFWNGNRSGKFSEELESFAEIESDKVPFNQLPEMKAAEIARQTIRAIESGKFDFLRINIANGDMVGHTGDLQATIRAMETVDACLAELLAAVETAGGAFIVTADHGNADDMVLRDGGGAPKLRAGKAIPRTSHTLAAVPFCMGGPGLAENVRLRPHHADDGLANITATFLNLLGFQAPQDYEKTLLGSA